MTVEEGKTSTICPTIHDRRNWEKRKIKGGKKDGKGVKRGEGELTHDGTKGKKHVLLSVLPCKRGEKIIAEIKVSLGLKRRKGRPGGEGLSRSA